MLKGSPDELLKRLGERRQLQSAAFGFPTAIDPRVLQTNLKDNDAVVLIAPSKYGTYVGAVTKNRTTPVSIMSSLTDEDVKKLVEAINDSLLADKKGRTKRFAIESSYLLYHQLLAPVLGEITGVSKLLIVPGNVISMLPFHALVTSDNLQELTWLGDKYEEISILPAAILLSEGKATEPVEIEARPELFRFRRALAFRTAHMWAQARHPRRWPSGLHGFAPIVRNSRDRGYPGKASRIIQCLEFDFFG